MPSAVAAGEPAAAARGPSRRRRRVTAWDLEVLVGANVVVVVGLWWRQGGISEIHDAAGLLTSLGRVTGMVGALLALVQLLLLARVPVLDEIALDRVNGWHRWNGIACVVLLVAHTVLITAGYALADGVGLGREISDLFGDYSGVLIATIGLVLLVAVAITSGAADSDSGRARVRCPGARKRQWKYCPERAPSPSRRRPPISSVTTPSAPGMTRATCRRWVASDRTTGTTIRNATIASTAAA